MGYVYSTREEKALTIQLDSRENLQLLQAINYEEGAVDIYTDPGKIEFELEQENIIDEEGIELAKSILNKATETGATFIRIYQV